MIEIKDLLARFNKLLLSEDKKIECIRDIISKSIHLEIKKEDVKIKNNVIFLNIKPIYKSEVFLKQEEIFSQLKECFGARGPKEVR
ncbi:MAG: hypothetical protein ABIS26_01685 [Candidatus Paceibacterota bacterium]